MEIPGVAATFCHYVTHYSHVTVNSNLVLVHPNSVIRHLIVIISPHIWSPLDPHHLLPEEDSPIHPHRHMFPATLTPHRYIAGQNPSTRSHLVIRTLQAESNGGKALGSRRPPSRRVMLKGVHRAYSRYTQRVRDTSRRIVTIRFSPNLDGGSGWHTLCLGVSLPR